MPLPRSPVRRKLVGIAIILYVLGFAAGLCIHRYSPDLSDKLYDQMVASFRAEFEGLDKALPIYTKIFTHNLSISAIMAFAGVVFAIPPVFILIANGIPLGLILARSERPVIVVLGSILPHGIFELPATFLAAAFGMLLGLDAAALISGWMKGQGEVPTRILVSDVKKVLGWFLLIAVLLAIAAAIETLLFLWYSSA